MFVRACECMSVCVCVLSFVSLSVLSEGVVLPTVSFVFFVFFI